MAFSAVRCAPKPQLDHFSCMPARKVGKHCSPHFKKKNQDKKSPGQSARLRNPVALLEFRLVAKQGFDVRSTSVLSMRSTQLTHGLHFATAKPAPRVFAVQSYGLCPWPGFCWSKAVWSVVSAPSSPCLKTKERGCRVVLQLPSLRTRHYPQQQFCSVSKALCFYKLSSGILQ